MFSIYSFLYIHHFGLSKCDFFFSRTYIWSNLKKLLNIMFLFQRQELSINEKNCLYYVHVEVHEHLAFISNLRLVLPPIFSILICMQVETYNFNVVMLFLSLILCYGMVLKMINLRYHEVLTALSLSLCGTTKPEQISFYV